MAKLAIKRATTSKIVRIVIQDSTSSSGAVLTGLVFNSAGLTAYYIREGDATPTAITLVTATVGTWTSGGFKEVDAANMPGVYELHLPNAALSTGNSTLVLLKGATNMLAVLLEIELDAFDYQDAVRLGLTALPNVAAGASGGLPTGNASGQTTVATVATGAIVAGSFAAGAIDAAAIATDAIGSAELAASAVTEIQTGLATSASQATLQADTDDIQTRLPAALVSGRMDSSVGAMASNVLTAAAINADALTAAKVAADVGAEIATAVRTELAVELARIDAAITSRLATAGYTAPVSAATLAAAVWDELIATHLGAGKTGAALNAAGSAGDPWTTPLPGAYGAGTAGSLVAATNAAVDTEVAAIKAKTDNLPASPAAVGSAMLLTLTQAIPDGQTIGTVGDALVAAEVQGGGAWTLVGTTLTLKRRNGTTWKTFTLDSATVPTSRT